MVSRAAPPRPKPALCEVVEHAQGEPERSGEWVRLHNQDA